MRPRVVLRGPRAVVNQGPPPAVVRGPRAVVNQGPPRAVVRGPRYLHALARRQENKTNPNMWPLRTRSSSSSAFLLVMRREILVNTKEIICKLRSKIMSKLRGAGDRFGDYLRADCAINLQVLSSPNLLP